MDDLRWLLDKAWILLAGLVGVIWNTHRKELADIKAELNNKADKADVERQQTAISVLNEAHSNLRNDMNGGFQSIRDLIHEGQIAIIREIASKADK
jgi:biotin-(acetyl-CoA carboxylase) ligase